MDTRKVSIIIPIYNVEKYLDECIESVIIQTYKNIEIILVNDGSKDRSLEICKKYQLLDKRIVLLNKDNEGVSSARNLGLENATGEFVTFIDPDDYIEKNMIERAVIIASKYNADIVQWNSYYNKGNEQTKRKPITPELLERNNEEIELLQLDILSTIYEEKKSNISVGPIRGVWGKLYKKDILNNIKFDKELYAFEDGLFNLCAFNNAKRIVLFNEYLHHYRINPKSVCNSYKSSWVEQTYKILSKVKSFIDNVKRKNEFIKLYYVLACELFSSCLTRCIFHKDNNTSNKEKRKQLKEFIESDIYKEVFKNVKYKYLNNKQKLLIFLVKRKLINIIYCIYKIKNIIK